MGEYLFNLTDWQMKGYRASGKAGDTILSGNICDLAEKFTLTTNNPFLSDFDFVPTSPNGGTWKFSTRNGVTGGGNGQYTLEGPDTDRTGIVMNGWSVATAPVAGSGGGTVHVDLAPSDDCGAK